MATSDKKRVLFKYKFADSYNPHYTNGAWGGFTAHGEICVNFFLERTPLPHEQTHAVADNGAIGELVSSKPEDPDADAVMLRFVSTGVVMSVPTARLIVEFLQRQIALWDTQQADDETSKPRSH